MKMFIEKFKESVVSILPIVIIVFVISLTPLFDLPNNELIVFLVSAVLLIIGMTLFNIGAQLSMTPMGDYTGTGLIKTKKLSLILIVALFMGILVTIAEPDLIVLSEQVKDVINGPTFIANVGAGVGVFLVISLLKVIFNKKLSMLLLLFYLLLFALTALIYEMDKDSLVPLAYDSGGVTTGPITVPFIMAFGVGIAATVGGKNGSENSFGFVALCSIGPILVVMMSFLFSKGEISYTLPDYTMKSIMANGVLNILVHEAWNIIKALGLIFIFFIVLNYFIMKLPIKKLMQIIVGIVITFVGLVTFLTTASIGFLPIGFSLGSQLVRAKESIAILICFIIGTTVVLAEPAIHVLTSQVEEVTGGNVSKKSMHIFINWCRYSNCTFNAQN